MPEIEIKTRKGRILTWKEISKKRPGYAKPKTKRMAYNKFTLEEVSEKFSLKIVFKETIFEEENSFPVSEFLEKTLRRGTKKALKIDTEKARSELIVAPILMELQEILENQISFFSGTEFSVDKSKGLTGFCDFLICLDPSETSISAPVITLVEAKKDNIKDGFGQCIAEMVAAQLFNNQKNKNIHTIFGVITTGINWKFMKLEERTVYIEEFERGFSISDKNMDKLLGIFIKMLEKQPVLNTEHD